MRTSVLIGLVLFLGLASAASIEERDTVDEVARSKRWFGWGLGGLGLGYGYGLGWGYPYYGFYGKRDVEPLKEDTIDTREPHAEKLIDLHVGKRKRSVDHVETEVVKDSETTRAKRWFGWGGYGLGLGYGYGLGLGWGYPYYGFYGKRDTEPIEREVEEHEVIKSPTHIVKRSAEPIAEAVIPLDKHSVVEEDTIARERRQWGWGGRWGGWGGYRPFGFGGGFYRPYGGYYWGKRDANIEEPIVKRQFGQNFNNNNGGFGGGQNFNNNNGGFGFGGGQNFNNNNGR